MNRTPAGTDTDSAAEAANRKQAEYYRGLLVECRDEIDRAIVDYLGEMSSPGSRRDVAGARELRRLVRQAERERQGLDQMIAALDRRFPATNPTSLVPIKQRRRSSVAADRLHDQKVG